MIKAVIFDMDGLLIDSEPMWRKGEIKIFSELGITLTEDDCRSTIGMRIDEVVPHWAAKFPEVKLDIPNIIKAIHDLVIQLIKTESEALPGVLDTIDFLHKKGIPMAVASASPSDFIEMVVKKMGIADKMQFLHSASNMEFGKPHPQVFIETARRLNVPYNECLVFEDSVFGVIAARAALMKVIAIPDEYQFNRVEYAIAHKKLHSMEDFSLNMLESL